MLTRQLEAINLTKVYRFFISIIYKEVAMHPLTALLSIILLFIQLLLIKHPLAIIMAFLLLIGMLLHHKKAAIIATNFKYTKWPILVVLLINPIAVNYGDTVLLSFQILKFTLSITAESIVYSVMMSIKLFSIMIGMQLLPLISSGEDLFTFFNNYFRQLTLTLSMSSNAIGALKEEYDRVQMVMLTRGMPLKEQGFSVRIKRSVYLVKVVFISVLEGTFHRSEALFVRSYTKNPGTDYQPLTWRKTDQYILGFLAIITTLIAVSILSHGYFYQYYPQLLGTIASLPLVTLVLTLTTIYIGLKEQIKNEQLLF